MSLRSLGGIAAVAGLLTAGFALVGCEPAASTFVPIPPDTTGYLGASACGACHGNLAALHARHPHAHALTPVLDGQPAFPAGPGVPAPPAGLDWPGISLVVGGYTKSALFVDASGFVLTDGTAHTLTQYNPALPAVDLGAEFSPYLPAQTTPLAFDFARFAHRTTGALSFDENGGRRQGNLPGIGGTWAEAGVQCEACHGPGSQHPADPTAGHIELAGAITACARCHSNTGNPGVIAVADELIVGFQQATELDASPHRNFACSTCHEPHTSTTYDRAQAIRNECETCHPTQNMAVHKGFVFVRGDYVEPVTCVSCHMPYLVQTARLTDHSLTNGKTVRLGDTRSHLFKLDPESTGPSMFAAAGTQIARDTDGRASISTCYVCQRCHDGQGNAFAFPPDEGCAFGNNIHGAP